MTNIIFKGQYLTSGDSFMLKRQFESVLEKGFGFNRSEIRGFHLLSSALIISIAFKLIFSYQIAQRNTSELSVSPYNNMELPAIGSIESAYDDIESENKVAWLEIREKFDPNQVTANELENMGLPKDLARRWENYLSKGGSFKTKEEISKLYGITEEMSTQLLPWMEISLPKKTASTKKADHEKTIKNTSYVGQKTTWLNEADTSDLKTVRGIGSYFAKQIVEYRERLGGFYAMEQLFEVYRIDTAKVDAIAEKFNLEPAPKLRKIPINTISVEDFSAHPYVGYTMGKIIINYRDVHGEFSELADLGVIKHTNADKLRKLAPYLDFDSR